MHLTFRDYQRRPRDQHVGVSADQVDVGLIDQRPEELITVDYTGNATEGVVGLHNVKCYSADRGRRCNRGEQWRRRRRRRQQDQGFGGKRSRGRKRGRGCC